MDYDNIWRGAFLKAMPIVFRMTIVLLVGLTPLYIILKMTTKTELMHYRLQALLREHNFPDLEYLGERPSYKTGNDVPWYRIGAAEVPVDAITDLDSEEEMADEET
jgi:hypothetical protein